MDSAASVVVDPGFLTFRGHEHRTFQIELSSETYVHDLDPFLFDMARGPTRDDGAHC